MERISSHVTSHMTHQTFDMTDGLNMYGFVGNDPVNGVDLFGLDRITDNEKVKKQMCCLLKSSGLIDDNGNLDWNNFGNEDAFAVYEHSKNGMFKTENGTTIDRTKSSVTKGFPKSGGGWKPIAYIHTHPPYKDPWPSSYDNRQAKSLGNSDINTYTVNKKGIIKYPFRDILGNSSNFPIWCKENLSKWKDCCK